MLTHLYKVLHRREQKRLAAKIAPLHPEWDAQNDYDKICYYLVYEVSAFTLLLKQYEEGKLPERPYMSALLVQALRFYATASASTYAFMFIQKQIEVSQLNQVVTAQKALTTHYQSQEQTIQTLANKATELVNNINEATKPDNRLN